MTTKNHTYRTVAELLIALKDLVEANADILAVLDCRGTGFVIVERVKK